MLKTVLLLDGSNAMNSTEEYSPNYLFAVRQPLFRFVRSYLQSTTLASLGLVVMRDGVAKCLHPCTTNIRDLLIALEVHYFLYGGVGSLSLENGLRASLPELVENPQRCFLGKRGRGPDTAIRSYASEPLGEHPQEHEEERIVNGIDARVLLFSASVTVVDPTDVLRVVRMFTKAKIQIDVVSILGAVHIFQECARRTGGQLYCPQSYKHLGHLLQQLALGHFSLQTGMESRIRSRHRLTEKEKKGEGQEGERRSTGRNAPLMIPVGFPLWSEVEEEERKLKSEPSTSSTSVKEEKESLSEGKTTRKRKVNAKEGEKDASSTTAKIKTEAPHRQAALSAKKESHPSDSVDKSGSTSHSSPTSASPPRRWRLCCPQCRHPQTSIPSTCPRCALRLCSVPFIYSMFVKRNQFLPPVRHYHPRSASLTHRGDEPNGNPVGRTEEKNEEVVASSSSSSLQSCEMCAFRVPAVVICCHCGVHRCEDCQKYCEDVLSLCPTCVSLQ